LMTFDRPNKGYGLLMALVTQPGGSCSPNERVFQTGGSLAR
jgi:hypothetical protein